MAIDGYFINDYWWFSNYYIVRYFNFFHGLLLDILGYFT